MRSLNFYTEKFPAVACPMPTEPFSGRSIRIIPRLDIKGPNLVKGVHLEGLRVLGKPEYFAKYYYEHGADELIYMDVVASLYGRNSLLEIVEKTSKEIFIPLTVGGGLRTLDDIQTVLRAGADKVSLNTAAIHRPELIREAAEKFGSSTIVVAIEAMKTAGGSYEAYTNNGREKTGVEVIHWAKQAVSLGAGEIMITSIDQEGTGDGFDVDLTRKITEAVQVPVIASGGAGQLTHIMDVITRGRADAVSLAAMLHYFYIANHDICGDFLAEGNIHFIQQGRSFRKVQPTTLETIKKHLAAHNLYCHIPEVPSHE